MVKNKKNYSAPALEKGLDILELLSDSNLGLSQAEIAKKLNRTVNEIYRMLNILVSRNYIQLDNLTESYQLTYKLLEISSRHQPIKNLMQKSMPVMREIAQLSNQSLHLSIYYAGKLLIIGQVDSPSQFNYSVPTGSTFDLLATSSGRVILAYQTQEERKRRLERRKLFLKYENKKLSKSQEIHSLEKKFTSKTVHEIIKNKCEVVKSLQIDGVTNICAPIFDHSNQAIAAMTIPYINRINKTKLDLSIKDTTKLLITKSLILSRSLGFNS
tara:strand:- start:1738 stop:2550 length:813 start_codon:yes stop_codon:yes gene_type:complete